MRHSHKEKIYTVCDHCNCGYSSNCGLHMVFPSQNVLGRRKIYKNIPYLRNLNNILTFPCYNIIEEFLIFYGGHIYVQNTCA